MKNKDLNDLPISNSNKSIGYPERRFNSIEFRGHKSEAAANGVGLPMTLLFFTIRPLRVRASTISAIAHFHGLVNGGSRAFNEREVNYRSSNEFWFVKVVCTLLLRSNFLSDTCAHYLCEKLDALNSFEVIKRLNNPNLGLKFLEFSRVNLNLSHSVMTYNLLIRSLCEVGLHDSAKVVFDHMKSDGHFPGCPMIQFFVSSCIRAGKCDIVKGLLSQFRPGEAIMSTLVYNGLLNVLVKQNKVDDAVYMFKEHFRLYSQPDSWTFNILIRGLCRIREVNKAFEFFYDMRSFGCSPDVVTYNTLINGLCRVNEVVRGHELLKEIKFKREVSPDDVTYTSVISGYCKLGKMEEASSIYDEWVVSSLIPIMGGVVLASATEVSFNWAGFWTAMASNLTNQSRNVLSKKVMVNKEESLDNITLFSIITVMSFIMMIPVTLFMEGVKFTPAYLQSAGLNLKEVYIRSLLAALCYHAYQQVSYMILQRVSPVTHSVGNCVKRVVVIVSSVLFFQTPVSPINAFGTGIALAGVFLYSRAKRIKPKAKTA